MSHFRARLALAKYPPFMIYLVSCLVAAFGNGMGYIATSWIVVSYHANVSAMSILMACFWGPNIIFGPLAGVLADRLPRKNLMLASNILRAAIFIFFSFYLYRHNDVDIVYLLMLCNGLAFSLFYSSAYAFTRELIPSQQLMHANSAIDIMYEVGNVVGMGAAGFLIAFTSPERAILMDGFAFTIASICMFIIPKSVLSHGKNVLRKKIRVWSDFHEGLAYLINQKRLLVIYTIQLLIFVTFLTAPLLLLPFSKTVLHASVKQFGSIEACGSVGIVIGGILMPWLAEKLGLAKTLLFFSCSLCLAFLYFGFNRLLPVSAMLYFLIGFSGAIWPLIITQAQNLTDLSFQGRVQSTFNSLSGIVMMIFYLLVGTVSLHFSVASLYVIEVIITAIAIIFLIMARKSF